jgi:hypothetical protein
MSLTWRSSALEILQGKFILVVHIALVIEEEIFPVLESQPFLFLIKVVGQVGRQPFGPVPLCRIYIDKIPKPLVEDFMTEGGFYDKGSRTISFPRSV